MPIKKIERLSEFLGVDPAPFLAHNVLNPILGVDSRLFVDPQRLMLTKIPEFAESRKRLEQYLAGVLKLISYSKETNDIPWKRAVHFLMCPEIHGVGLGFCMESDAGSGIGKQLAERVAASAAFLLQAGIHDPALVELLALYEDDFGADRLSDLTLSILREDFLAYTERIAAEMKCARIGDFLYKQRVYKLPMRDGKTPITLLPQDLLRPLPIATDQEEIQEAASLHKELRDYWGELVHSVAREYGRDPAKIEIRKMFEAHPDFFNPLIQAYRDEKGAAYDLDSDPEGLFRWANLASKASSDFPLRLKPVTTIEDLVGVAEEIVLQFKKNIEENGLNRHLYDASERPLYEKFSQLLFFASADAYIRANKLDISPESNAGRGPVDFKISKGDLKVVAELKLSRNSDLRHGYTVQLDTYQAVERAGAAYFIVVKVNRAESLQLKELKEFVRSLEESNTPHPKLIIVDGLIYPSASKA